MPGKRAQVLTYKQNFSDMKRYLIVLLTCALLVGCASTRHAANTYHESTDFTYINRGYLDSLIKAITQRDSTHIHDSIYVREKGDTVTIYKEKIVYQYKERSDKEDKVKQRTDTVYINHTDSIYVEKPYPVEKQLKWYDTGFLHIGRLCCIAAILWALFLYLKRKF